MSTKTDNQPSGVTGDPSTESKVRWLTGHKVNSLNDHLNICVLDQPGDGGANHEYWIALINAADNSQFPPVTIKFQKGPIKESGFNGLSNEALLEVVIDRMRGFQSGPFKSRDNACALTHLEEAMMWLQKRTRERMARGVEGTHQV